MPLAIVGPMLTAQLGPIDDHEIPWMLASPLTTLRTHLVEPERFRPAWWVFRVLEMQLWHGWAGGMYFDRLLLMAATVFGAFAIARRFTPHAALVGALVVAGPQAQAWYWLGMQEALGAALLIGGVALILGRHAAAGLLLLVFAAATKESFVPFALVASLLAIGRTSRLNVGVAVTVIALIGAWVAILFASGHEMYGLERSPAAVVEAAAWSFAVVPAMWLAPLAIRNRWALLGVALWAGSVFVYAGMRGGHYLLPGALVGVVATGYVMTRHRRLVPVVVVAAAVAIALQGREAWLMSQRTRDWQQGLAAVQAALRPDTTLVVSFDWEWREEAIAVPAYVSAPRLVLDLPPNPPGDVAVFLEWARGNGYNTDPATGPCVALALEGAVPYPCAVIIRIEALP